MVFRASHTLLTWTALPTRDNMTPVEYNNAYADGAQAMRNAIRENLKILKRRMQKDKDEGKIPLAAEFDIDNLFINVLNMVDIRVDGEPDKVDYDA